MIEALAQSVVFLTGLYFCALGVASLFLPGETSQFLLGFASSARAHYAELLIRILVGWSLIYFAPHMSVSVAFWLFGWTLVITSSCLFLLPWQMHRRFAQWAVPQAIRFKTLFGLCSLALGGVVIAAITYGSTT